ncbi:MAG TPA: S8 family peptidase, partial [Pyrinomonadaceae bacterium]|nr:S8 family peptidase [Pyrinomonadaceae bacterium]
MKKSYSQISRLAACLLLAGVCVWAFPFRTANAGAGNVHKEKDGARDKVASDLRDKIGKARGGERLKVIVQPDEAWNDSLDSAVSYNNGTTNGSYTNFNARTITLPASAVQALAARTDVKYLTLDREVKQLGHLSLTTGADAARAVGGAANLDGTGVGIVVMDSGLDPKHTAFDDGSNKTRVVYQQDFTNERRTDDPYGHGTHVASIAAGNGDVAQGAYRGIAPNARIINLRVLDSQGKSTTSTLLRALDWVLTNRNNPNYKIKVVNLSLGTAAVDSYRFDPLCEAARRLVAAGIVVVAAAGNEGKDGAGKEIYGQIHAPGNDPSVITVGASNSLGTDQRADDVMTTYSSRGPTRSFWADSNSVKHYDNLLKPDLVAPGNKIVAAQSAGNYLVSHNPSLAAGVSNNAKRDQMYLSGTSMATPVVSGAAALLLQANPSLTPNLVKALLMYTAQPLKGFNHFEQGAGEINVEGAVRLAEAIRGDALMRAQAGRPMLVGGDFPVPQTTIAGFTFPWASRIVLGPTTATSTDFISKYQKVY